MSAQRWHQLPPELVQVFRPRLPELADAIIEAVRTVPAYSRPLESPFGLGVRAGVEEALDDPDARFWLELALRAAPRSEDR
jgi:hypothetical protein